ncbi:response regulator, partial [Streptomyces sp. URMC 124]
SIDWEDYGVSEVLQVEDGAEALRKATIHRPEIVITDIRMHKLNGIEFAERLVAACPDSKLLFISGYMDVAYLKSAIRLAAVDFVEKPIKLPE